MYKEFGGPRRPQEMNEYRKHLQRVPFYIVIFKIIWL